MKPKPFVLFKRIEVDLDKERKRIAKADYDDRQRAALTKLVDLFEQGKWQECLTHVNDKTAFPYNKEGEYPEQEHISMEIGDLLHDMAHYNFYTRDDILEQAEQQLKKLKRI